LLTYLGAYLTRQQTPLTLEPERNGIEEPHDDAFTYGWTIVRILTIHRFTEFAGAIQFSASEQF
jgi:hypothetical protein